MKIGEGLQQLNILKGQLTRLQKQRIRLFELTEKDTPEYTFDDITNLIREKHKEIIQLKSLIQKVNSTAIVHVGEKELILMEAILEAGMLRSELSQLNEKVGASTTLNTIYSEKTTKLHIPITQTDLEERIRELETKKRQLDLAIQVTNWKVEI